MRRRYFDETDEAYSKHVRRIPAEYIRDFSAILIAVILLASI